jgi:hypothetical protein
MRSLLTILILLLLAFVPAAAQGKGKGKGKGKEGQRFLPEEIQIIMAYYGPAPGSLPPGLARRGGGLPPGLAKQLRRNGRLPPGLEKRFTPFPPVLVQRLPPPPPGYRRVVYDRWAMLIYDAGNVVLDAIELTRR